MTLCIATQKGALTTRSRSRSCRSPSLSSFSAGWSWINGSPRVTLQLAAGTNPKIVSEVLGHMEIAIILDRYSHALPTMQAEAIARLDSILGRGDDGPLSASARQRFRFGRRN